MTIDTKRLANDAAYWDSLDPTGGEATFFDPVFDAKGEQWALPWVKEENGVKYHLIASNAWQKWDHLVSVTVRKSSEYIPRPTKQPAPEWTGEGLPPVGCECEVSYAGYWVKAKVVHSTASGILVSEMFGKFPGKVHISVDPRKFRPLRTKGQRQRDDLANEISKAAHRLGFTLDLNESDKLSDAAIKFFEERYNLEPKP